MLAVALVGSVDHGKSTLLGRLLYETGAVPEARVAQLALSSRKRGVALEWSFLLDSFQAERDQAVTIDVTEIRVVHAGREFTFIDAPGHVEFLRNLITGAARSDAAVLLIDAAQGGSEQTRRHSALLRLLGVRDVVVAVNKIDLCADAQSAYAEVAHAAGEHLARCGLAVRGIVPTISREGVNLLERSPHTPWYAGPTLLEALCAIEPRREATSRPLRLPVQDVYRLDNVRYVVGRISTGSLRQGDEVLLLPTSRKAHVAALHPTRVAHAGDNVAIEFDSDVFVERGHWIGHADHAPKLTRVIDAEVFWLDPTPLAAGTTLEMRLATTDAVFRVQSVRWVLSVDGVSRVPAAVIERFAIGGVTLRADRPVPVDDFATLPVTGRFVLSRGNEVVGIGIADTTGYPDLRPHEPRERVDIRIEQHALTDPDRQARYGHPGAVVWLTGLSGAGKSTLAMELERRLFAGGYAAYVLDGDNLRHGLNADLGFDPDARRENVRRAGEVAALFADAGLICIVALISPYRDDRERARATTAPHPFYEVFVDAPLAVCEARDPKGLYRKARAHTIAGFTGIDAPYERPEAPDLVVRTDERSIDGCELELFDFVTTRLAAWSSGNPAATAKPAGR